jgi:hypothetical protein
MKEIIWTFAICLLLTLVLEEAVALIAGVRRKFDLAVIFFANTLTNPPVVLLGLLLPSYTDIPRPVYVILLEAAVFVTEALIYRKLLYTRRPNSFFMSLILNGVSFIIGTPVASLILKLLI